MAKLATFLRSRQKGWELDRYEFSPWWHKYSMFLNSFLPNLQGKKYFFAEVTLTRLVPFWGDLPIGMWWWWWWSRGSWKEEGTGLLPSSCWWQAGSPVAGAQREVMASRWIPVGGAKYTLPLVRSSAQATHLLLTYTCSCFNALLPDCWKGIVGAFEEMNTSGGCLSAWEAEYWQD